ncbi:MAG: hypothetical protein ACRD6W_11705 [Nitrososphaerales archaeon]
MHLDVERDQTEAEVVTSTFHVILRDVLYELPRFVAARQPPKELAYGVTYTPAIPRQ